MSQMTSAARVGARALNRPANGSPRLRVVPGTPLRRGDAAFGIICVVLLAAGLIGLLLLNTTLAQGSFVLQKLQTTSDQLKDTQGILNQSLDASKSPGNLATLATSMGMVPAQSAAFLRISDGKVIGVAEPAPAVSGFTVVGTAQPGAANPADPTNPTTSPARPGSPGNTSADPSSPAAGAVSGAATPAAQGVETPPSNAAPTPSATRPATPASDAGRAGAPARR